MSDAEPTLIDHVRASNLIARFLLELVMLAGAAVAGWRAADGAGASIGLAIAAPVSFGLVWGAVIAPKARWRLADPARFVAEVILFGAVVGGLSLGGLPVLGIIVGTLAGVNMLLMLVFRQRGL